MRDPGWTLGKEQKWASSSVKLWHSPTDGRSQSREPWARHPEHPCLSLHQSPCACTLPSAAQTPRNKHYNTNSQHILGTVARTRHVMGTVRISYLASKTLPVVTPSITHETKGTRKNPLARVAGPERSRAENGEPGHRAPRGPSGPDTGVSKALLHVPERQCAQVSPKPA